MRADMLALYVHIPICLKKCAYCDFCSYPNLSPRQRADYIDALILELDGYKREPRLTLDTLFFGGGTPSLLEPDEFNKLAQKIREVFDTSALSEFTLEANPKTLTREKLLAYREGGVNRISIGLQSIHEKELKNLGRIHSYNDFLESYKLVREVGIENVNVDIMYSIPDQTLESFLKTVDCVISLSPEHISAYSLILEEGTPLYMARDSLCLPSVESECRMYDALCERMASAGYVHYEISNYAKPSRECRHNLVYW